MCFRQLQHWVPCPGESPDIQEGPHRIHHRILRPLVSGTQFLPGDRFKHQISGHLPCKRRACLQRVLTTETKDRSSLPGLLIEANIIT